MTEWKKLVCPSCQEVIGTYVWGKFQVICYKCKQAVLVRTRLLKNMKEEEEDVRGET